MGLRNAVKEFLRVRLDREYESRLEARQVTYEKWISKDASGERELSEERELSAAEQAKFKDGMDGIWIFCSGMGKMAGNAKRDILEFFQQHPEALIVYGDEDVQDPERGERRSPWFKPDWSPDTFESWFYFGSLVAVRQSLLEKCAWWNVCSMVGKAGVCEYPDREILCRWMAELTALAGGYCRSCRTIGHLKAMLFHCRDEEQQEEYLTWKMEDFLHLDSSADSCPKVSVIIPSRDNPHILARGVRSLIDTAGVAAYEILVVDNGSREENRAETEDFLRRMEAKLAGGRERIRYLYEPMEFNFSKMCNLGAGQARGEALLFLNDDVELCCEGWMDKMLEHAVRGYTGAVGLKLRYPGSKKIQHAGITNLPMGPVHKLQFLDDSEAYYFGRNRMDGNVLAVTGACLMVRADKFREAGGFAEEMPVAFNDVDLCFALYGIGYQNMVLNTVYAWHHESLSRGSDECTAKQARLAAERKKLYERHPGLEGVDPYYPEGLNHDGLDTRIRPAYLTSGNIPQSVSALFQELDLNSYREDPCLLIRVEYAGADGIQGYSVVLGDDNACYDKQLFLCPLQDLDKEGPCNASSQRAFCIPLEGLYRPDLQENMSEQTNVALSGFSVRWTGSGLPKGSYRIAAAARNRITGLKLRNASNRVLIIEEETARL